MPRWTRTASLAALLLAACLAPMKPTVAADAGVPVIHVAASEATSRYVPLGIGKSVAIDLPADIKDVLVADPKIANAVIRTSRRVYIIGVKVGQTNIFFFDADGRQIAGFDIAVTRDLNGLRGALRQNFPNSDIRIEGVGDGVMLSGTAANSDEAQQAYDLASRLVGDGTKVVNGIAVRGRDQVMLKVSVAEVSRDVIKQLGIDLSGKSGGSETQTSEMILKNIRVLAIDQTISEKDGQKVITGKTATLELSPRQAETLTLAQKLGSISLALRSIADATTNGKDTEDDDNSRRSSVNVIRFGVPTTTTPK